jgi:hypothetical protein
MAPALVALIALILYAIPYVLLAASPGLASGAIAGRLGDFVTPAQAVRVALEVTPPIRAAGGEIDRLAIEIASATVAGALPVEHFALEANDLRFDVAAIALRQELVLRSPVAASASVTLTEGGLTEMLQSEVVRGALRGLTPPKGFGLPGLGIQPRLDFVPSGARLADGRIEIKGQVQMPDMGIALPLTFSTRPVLVDPSHVTVAETRVVVMGRTISSEQIAARMPIPVIDLDAIATGDLRIRVSKLELAGGKLQLQANAIVTRIPPTPSAPPAGSALE